MNAINKNGVSMFKVGDKVVNDAFINSDIYVFKELMPEIGMALIAHDDDEGACGLYSLRHATPEEIAAGHRKGSKEFDFYWYGQSEADAIKEHEIYQEELIKGGVRLVGNNSNIVKMINDMGDDSHIENHVSPNCKKFDERVK